METVDLDSITSSLEPVLTKLMGIRFFCPQCQSRLNVKSSQAGGAGICPDCGATVHVPDESILPGQPKSPDERFYTEEKNPPEGSSQLIGIDAQDTIVGDLAGEPAVGSIQVPPEKLAPVFATTQDKSSSGIFMLDRPSPSPDFGKVDPISAAPGKVWYFRNQEIGERGPLKSKVMQKCVDSGEVSAGTLVWREDWEDWAAAEEAFPQIQPKSDPTENALITKNKLELATNLTSRQMFFKQVLFYGVIVAGLAVVAALAYVVIWISDH